NIPGSYIKMPDCLDMSLEDAKAMIVDAFGGAVKASDIKETEVFREGTKGNVFECQPSPGTPIDIANIPTIKLYICKGTEPEEVTMPDIIGLPKDEAFSILTENKITSYTVEREYSEGAANIVLRTSIKEGETFMNDTEVIVYVSEKNRNQAFTMPDCIGSSKKNAVSRIAARFRLSEDAIKVVEEYNDTVSKGKVYATLPVADTLVTDLSGTSFTVYVSKGKQPDDAEMPNVEGRTLSEAGIILDNAGFGNISTEYVDSEETRNTVLYANYSVGAILSEDTEIVLTVSNGTLAGDDDSETEDKEETENGASEDMDELLGVRENN
ncbi:MAG: PASTA domain-containing protein, partial [Clostridia bacterium]|nr:PASTA domain-containing protein [Clostridia bacterium]